MYKFCQQILKSSLYQLLITVHNSYNENISIKNSVIKVIYRRNNNLKRYLIISYEFRMSAPYFISGVHFRYLFWFLRKLKKRSDITSTLAIIHNINLF